MSAQHHKQHAPSGVALRLWNIHAGKLLTHENLKFDCYGNRYTVAPRPAAALCSINWAWSCREWRSDFHQLMNPDSTSFSAILFCSRISFPAKRNNRNLKKQSWRSLGGKPGVWWWFLLLFYTILSKKLQLLLLYCNIWAAFRSKSLHSWWQ